MRVQNDGQTDLFFKRFDQVVTLLRSHDARHVLDAYCGHAHFLHFGGDADKIVKGLDGARGVGNGSACDCSRLDGFFDRNLNIPCVVERVENTDYVYAVFHTLFDEHFYHVVGIMTVAQKVLSPKQHLQLGVFDLFADFSQSFPRVLV